MTALMPIVCFSLAAMLFAVVLWPWPAPEPDVRALTVSAQRRGGARHGMRKPNITIEPRPNGRWAVQKDGTQRASKLFDRQSDAEARGRAQAEREGAELVIKGRDGRIKRRDSHGRDDRRSKG